MIGIAVSTDGGQTWAEADFLDPVRRFAWRRAMSCGSQENPPPTRRRRNWNAREIECKCVQAACLGPAPRIRCSDDSAEFGTGRVEPDVVLSPASRRDQSIEAR